MSNGSTFATFFFVDIVALSDPILTMTNQAAKIAALNEFIMGCPSFRATREADRYILPTGDGMAIGFTNSPPNVAVDLAIELHKALNSFNRGKELVDMIRVRIGINNGIVIQHKDILHRDNFWGDGITLARRVMDLGKDGHILITERTAEELRALSATYRDIIHPLDYYPIKHGKKIMICSIYGDDFGNPERPHKPDDPNVIRFHSMKVHLKLISEDVTALYVKNSVEIQNLTESPLISPMAIKIRSENPMTLEEVKVKVTDGDGKPMKYVVTEKKATLKQFAIQFDRPLQTGERTKFSWEYNIMEPRRQSSYPVLPDLSYLEVTFEHSKDSNMQPRFYAYDLQSRQTRETQMNSSIDVTKNGTKLIRWHKWTPSFQAFVILW
jgi:hypothetical protein